MLFCRCRRVVDHIWFESQRAKHECSRVAAVMLFCRCRRVVDHLWLKAEMQFAGTTKESSCTVSDIQLQFSTLRQHDTQPTFLLCNDTQPTCKAMRRTTAQMPTTTLEHSVLCAGPRSGLPVSGNRYSGKTSSQNVFGFRGQAGPARPREKQSQQESTTQPQNADADRRVDRAGHEKAAETRKQWR